MLAERVRSAAIFVPPVVIVLALGGPWIALAVVALAAGAGAETFRLLKTAGYPSLPALGTLGAVAVVVSISAPTLLGALGTAAGAFADRASLAVVMAVGLAAVGAFARPDPREGLATWAATTFGLIYASLIGFVVQVGQAAPAIAPDAPLAILGAPRAWIVILIGAVWSYDSGAYLFGKRFGRARFLSHISPSKTYAGLIGGMACATLAVGVILVLVGRSPLEAIVLGPLLSLAAQAGDLAGSMLKRAAGAKDSGHLFPGHGGLLDRIDSFLFAGPMTALYVVLVR